MSTLDKLIFDIDKVPPATPIEFAEVAVQTAEKSLASCVEALNTCADFFMATEASTQLLELASVAECEIHTATEDARVALTAARASLNAVRNI